MSDDWMTRAACAGIGELFFPVGTGGPALIQVDQAKAMCRRCPVLWECRDWALSNREPHGVWGGLSEDDREQLLTGRHRRHRGVVQPAATSWHDFDPGRKGAACPGGDGRHGTDGGYKHGCRALDCTEAHAAAYRQKAGVR